jgi:asparagine synthase (glutamine-hydrolysing)
MCGFTGFYAYKTGSSRAGLHVIGRKMTDSLAHRGPDSQGQWQDPDSPLLLGHRRLAIIDLSPEGSQPMESASGRYITAYNGEIYNHPALRKELESKSIFFRGRSDTETLLAAIETWGLNQALQKINGMFAFALWDRKERKLHLVRDRLGKKPLYIGWAGETLVFGSELKALRAHPDFEARINRDALALYTRYTNVPAPHCIYEKVWSLPAGYRLSLDLQTLTPGEILEGFMESYWHHLRVLEEAQLKMTENSEEEIIAEFEELLSACVRDRMLSDVPLGAFLSGGIDSSTIVALMQKMSGRPVKTYAIGFEEMGFNEAPHAKKIATHLGTEHRELYLTGHDALNTVPLLPDIYDEPFADISAIPTFLVSKFARNDVTVALSGDGGDEMLGGYNRHFMGPRIWSRMKLMPRPARLALAKIIGNIPVTRWDNLARAKPQIGDRMHKFASVLVQETQEDIYSNLISQWTTPPVSHASHASTLLEMPDHRPDDLSFAEKMMYWDTLGYLPNDILVKLDRASMAVGLEARAPLLDKRLYEYAWTLPERYKIRGGQGKWLLRQVLKRHVPPSLYERPKQGFAMPVAAWLRGPLKDWSRDLLNDANFKEYFDKQVVQECWEQHMNGHGNHGWKLWTILMFQSWKQRWM